MFPFGADTVKTISPFLSVEPLTSIVVAPSIASAVIVSPWIFTAEESTSSIVTSAAVIVVAETDESEEPSLTSTSTDTAYFDESPWFAAIV